MAADPDPQESDRDLAGEGGGSLPEFLHSLMQL